MSLAHVKDACEGTTMCEIRCTKSFFGDDKKAGSDIYKYLEISFKCMEVINGHEVVTDQRSIIGDI